MSQNEKTIKKDYQIKSAKIIQNGTEIKNFAKNKNICPKG